MLKKFFVLSLTVFALAGCSKDDIGDKPENPQEVKLEVSRNDFVFDAAGGEKTFTLSCNGIWTIENDVDWCKTNLVGGRGNKTVTIEADECDSMENRKANLIVKAGDKTQVLEVLQKRKDAIVLSKDRFEVPAVGETISVEVKSNIEYEVTIPTAFREWISAAPPSRAVTERSFSFTVAENEGLEGREGYVVFSSASLKDTVYVKQAAKVFVLNKRLFEVPAAGETISVEVKSDMEYEMTIPVAFQGWIAATPASRAVTERSFSFTVAENEGLEGREGYVVFSSASLKDTVYVKQAAKEGFLLDKHRFEVSAGGETISVEVMSNVEYEVAIPVAFQEWITAVPASRAVTTTSHRFTVAANSGSDVREGYVDFVSGTLKETVYINQQSRSFTEKVNGVSFDMVYVKGGTFSMGATEEQGDDAYDDETPVHRVTLSDYYIGKFEVTQGLWEKVMGTTLEEQRDKASKSWPLSGKGSDYPMYYVSWEEAQEFCDKLSQLTGRKYALPTEAQWEYAARGGVKSKGYKYSGANTLDAVAWHWDNCKGTTRPVGTKQPNELGIYDMSGNVYEWCSDWYGEYSSGAVTAPVGPATGSYRVLRGGSWNDAEHRVSYRYGYDPSYRDFNYGFRVVLLP